MTGSEYKGLYGRSPNKAHRALFDEYCAYVYTVAHNRLRLTARKEDVEECVSDVFAELYRRLDPGDMTDGELKPLVSTFAKRRAIDRYRSLTGNNPPVVSLYEDDMSALDSGFDLEEEAERSELQRLVLKLISDLGEPDSTIVFQRYYFDRTSKEIAADLSMTSTAVRTRCSRALKRLRECLKAAGITQ